MATAEPTALAPPELTPAPPTPLAGTPAIVGIPLTIAGAFGLALSNIGYLDPAASGAAVPTVMTATAAGLLITTIWAAALGQNATAGVFGVFLGFYSSYAALVLGLNHNWFGVPADQVSRSIVVWLATWLTTVVLLTLTTLRLPWSYTLLLVLVDLALALLIAGTIQENTALTRLAAAVVFGFIAVAVYLFVDVMERETGGDGLPLGKPVLS